MAKKKTEEATTNTTIVADKMNEKAPEFNEFEGEIKHEGYDNLQPNIQGLEIGEDIIIPEAITSQPVIDFRKTNSANKPLNIENKPNDATSTTKQDEAKEVDVKSSKRDSKRLAAGCIFLYGALMELVYKTTNLETYKLEQRALKGNFDMTALEVEIPLNDEGTKTISIRKWLDNYNFDLKKALYINPLTGRADLTTEEWVKMSDDLAQVFSEYGFGLTVKEEFFFNLAMTTISQISIVSALRIDANRVLSRASEFLISKNIYTPYNKPKNKPPVNTVNNYEPPIIPPVQQASPPTPPTPQEINITIPPKKIKGAIKKKTRRLFIEEEPKLNTND